MPLSFCPLEPPNLYLCLFSKFSSFSLFLSSKLLLKVSSLIISSVQELENLKKAYMLLKSGVQQNLPFSSPKLPLQPHSCSERQSEWVLCTNDRGADIKEGTCSLEIMISHQTWKSYKSVNLL